MSFHVYVLMNPQRDIYIGQTTDLQRRFAQHNDPACTLTLHTKRRPGPWTLIHSEVFDTRAQAMQRERQLKTSRGRAWIRQLPVHDQACPP